MNKKLLSEKSYVLLVIASLFVLFYFLLTVEPRGDEGDPYLLAFNQAYSIWPGLDVSPAWSLSSPYLWLVSTTHAIFQSFFSLPIITSGRLLSLICWAVLAFLLLKEERAVRWNATFVLFNPYLLIFVTRAHPLMPALLLIYLFWKGIQHRSKFWGVWVLFAVTFQVFTGGVTAMLLPDSFKKNNLKSLWKAILGGAFALGGVFLTWATWGGGMYPEAFKAHEFFKIHHENGTLSFGYISLAFMITGGTMWIIGDKSFRESFFNKKEVLFVSVFLSLLAAILYFGKPAIGIVDTFLAGFLPEKLARLILVIVFIFMGIGWLRVGKSRFTLFFGVLGSAILMTVLPYLYERIAVFGTLAPCLIWILVAHTKTEKVTVGWKAFICLLFLCFACIYQVFGVL